MLEHRWLLVAGFILAAGSFAPTEAGADDTTGTLGQASPGVPLKISAEAAVRLYLIGDTDDFLWAESENATDDRYVQIDPDRQGRGQHYEFILEGGQWSLHSDGLGPLSMCYEIQPREGQSQELTILAFPATALYGCVQESDDIASLANELGATTSPFDVGDIHVSTLAFENARTFDRNWLTRVQEGGRARSGAKLQPLDGVVRIEVTGMGVLPVRAMLDDSGGVLFGEQQNLQLDGSTRIQVLPSTMPPSRTVLVLERDEQWSGFEEVDERESSPAVHEGRRATSRRAARAGDTHHRLVWDPRIDTSLGRYLTLPGGTWIVSMYADQRWMTKDVVGSAATLASGWEIDAMAHYGFSTHPTAPGIAKISIREDRTAEESNPPNILIREVPRQSMAEASRTLHLSSRDALGGQYRSLGGEVPDEVTEALSILAEIALENASARSLDLLADRLTVLVCDDLDTGRLTPTIRDELGIATTDELLFPETCEAVRGIRVEDIANQADTLYRALLADLVGFSLRYLDNHLVRGLPQERRIALEQRLEPILDHVAAMLSELLTGRPVVSRDAAEQLVLELSRQDWAGLAWSSETQEGQVAACGIQVAFAAAALCAEQGGCDAAAISDLAGNPAAYFDLQLAYPAGLEDEYWDRSTSDVCKDLFSPPWGGTPPVEEMWPDYEQFVARLVRLSSASGNLPPEDLVRETIGLSFDIIELLLRWEVAATNPSDVTSIREDLERFRQVLTDEDKKSTVHQAFSALGRVQWQQELLEAQDEWVETVPTKPWGPLVPLHERTVALTLLGDGVEAEEWTGAKTALQEADQLLVDSMGWAYISTLSGAVGSDQDRGWEPVFAQERALQSVLHDIECHIPAAQDGDPAAVPPPLRKTRAALDVVSVWLDLNRGYSDPSLHRGGGQLESYAADALASAEYQAGHLFDAAIDDAQNLEGDRQDSVQQIYMDVRTLHILTEFALHEATSDTAGLGYTAVPLETALDEMNERLNELLGRLDETAPPTSPSERDWGEDIERLRAGQAALRAATGDAPQDQLVEALDETSTALGRFHYHTLDPTTLDALADALDAGEDARYAAALQSWVAISESRALPTEAIRTQLDRLLQHEIFTSRLSRCNDDALSGDFTEYWIESLEESLSRARASLWMLERPDRATQTGTAIEKDKRTAIEAMDVVRSNLMSPEELKDEKASPWRAELDAYYARLGGEGSDAHDKARLLQIMITRLPASGIASSASFAAPDQAVRDAIRGLREAVAPLHAAIDELPLDERAEARLLVESIELQLRDVEWYAQVLADGDVDDRAISEQVTLSLRALIAARDVANGVPKKKQPSVEALARIDEYVAATWPLGERAEILGEVEQIVIAAFDQNTAAVIEGVISLIDLSMRSQTLTKNEFDFAGSTERFSALFTALTSYAQTYRDSEDEVDREAKREARKESLESLIRASTSRRHRDGDAVVSLGANVGFTSAWRMRFHGDTCDCPVHQCVPWALTMPMGVAVQQLPNSERVSQRRRLQHRPMRSLKGIAHGWHLQFSFIDLGNYLAYGVETADEESEADKTSERSALRWDQVFMASIQGGLLIGSPSATFTIALEFRLVPALFPTAATGEDDSIVDNPAGAIQAGIQFGFYVPFFDFN